MNELEPIFTPMNEARTERLRFKISDVSVVSGSLDTRERGPKAIVEIDNIRYEVIGIPCDLDGCDCDAMLAEI